jgi:hypothetical protein
MSAPQLDLEPPKGRGQLYDALGMKLGTWTFKIVLGGIELAAHATKTMEWAHLSPGGADSLERVIHANRVCCCELFRARSSLIVPPLDSSYSSRKLPITKPSFVTTGSRQHISPFHECSFFQVGDLRHSNIDHNMPDFRVVTACSSRLHCKDQAGMLSYTKNATSYPGGSSSIQSKLVIFCSQITDSHLLFLESYRSTGRIQCLHTSTG